MLTTFRQMLSYPFLVNALIVGILVSLCASLLGVSLVLKRYSMIGDGLSHVGFASLAVAYAVGAAPLTVAIPVCVISAFLLLRLNENSKIKGDAATALLCSSALAIGVMTISLTTGMNTDVCNYMFGSILAMSKSDVQLSMILSIVVIVLYVLFYHKIFAVTFDETFAKATGVHSNLYNMLIAMLTAVTVVLGMRMMGTLLISSLIIMPALSSMRICKQFRTVILCSCVLSIVCFVAGIYFSYMHSTPTGASIVCANMVMFVLFSIVEKIKKRKGKLLLVAMMMVTTLMFGGCNRSQSATLNNRMKSTDAAVNASQDGTASGNTQDTANGQSDGNGTSLSGTADAGGRKGYNYDLAADRNSYDGHVDITVGDTLYATQLNDWYMNFSQYEGKVVEIEGYFIGEYTPYMFVGRRGPSCPYCNGGYVSFEFYTNDDISNLQSDNDWITVTGILRKGKDDTGMFYYIEVLSLKKMDTVGKDTVTD